jgi:hypothetical protein
VRTGLAAPGGLIDVKRHPVTDAFFFGDLLVLLVLSYCPYLYISVLMVFILLAASTPFRFYC